MEAYNPGGDPEAAVEDELAELSHELIEQGVAPQGAEAARPGAEEGGRGAAELDAEDDGRPPESLSGVVTRGASLAGMGYVLSQVLTFVAYLVLARLATPADFGRFAAGGVIVNAGAVLGESGIEAALVHRRRRLQEAINSAFLATVVAGVGLTLLSLAAAPLVGLFFHSHETGVVAAVLSGWMLLRMLAIVPDALLMRRFSFARRVVIDPLSTVFFAAGAIPAAAAGLGVWALVIGTYASALLNVIAAWVFARYRPRPRLARFETWRELARFGRPVVIGNLIRRAVLEIPILAIGRFNGAAALGQFSYAARASTQSLGAVVNVGGYVLLPAFSRLSAHDERFRTAVRTALRWLCIVSFPVGMLLIPLGTPAVVLVFGHQWREAGHAATALAVYCAALSLDSIASEAWKANGRTDMLPRMHGLSLALTLVFVGGLVHFGLVWAAVGMSAAALGVAAYAVYGMSTALDIELRDLLREIWPATLASCLMAGALFCLEHFLVHADRYATVPGIALVALETVLGLVLYVGILGLFAPESTRQLIGVLRSRLGGALSRLRPA
ncbi:MAG TPA: oligosaccharide flippase family protein [Solirubrobacteraceae bacterium]|jgi:PST family polysaccharide transporter|nr:oligosaccharide flippase family protein [Solirubrobacteraceae bacterium]